MRDRHFILPLILTLFTTVASAAPTTRPAHWDWSPTPPMGWNSYDAFGDSVTENEVLANAQYVKDHLLAHGWKYVVVDFRWYDPKPTGDDSRLYQDRLNAELTMDTNGRLQPAPNRFPSAANGQGFKPLADEIHAMGLKFGIHVMRGIPRMTVKGNFTIAGSSEKAWDATNFSTCVWCPDMFGVDASHPAGQAWYDSIFRQYADWGVDFVKVDDLSVPYSVKEIEAIRKAIDRSGRAIVFSTSPGPTSPSHALHLARNANTWRISGDFWDRWSKLSQQFDLMTQWQGVGGPGHWPDADMIPFGRIAIRSRNGGTDHMSHFTPNEKLTLLSLWALEPSPLMLGGNLPDNDDAMLSMLTNDDVLAIDQDAAGIPAKRISKIRGAEVWLRDLSNGDKAAGLFNRGNSDQPVTLNWADDKLFGKYGVRDLWKSHDLGTFDNQIKLTIPAHGVTLLRLTPRALANSN